MCNRQSWLVPTFYKKFIVFIGMLVFLLCLFLYDIVDIL